MSVRHLSAAAVLAAGIALTAPASANASVQQTAAVSGMTSGRLGPTLTALVALIGVVLGGLALVRARGANGDSRAIAALVSGLIGIVVGGFFAATADGGPGTGNGIVGAFAAVAFGLVGAVLGGLALARSRRTGARL